jgi:predicted Zn-dependent protease
MTSKHGAIRVFRMLLAAVWLAASSAAAQQVTLERPDLPWHFGVPDTPSVNAFAAPGGYVLITRGLYEMLASESQLAGVLEHEIGHIVQRHHVKVMQQSAAVSAGYSPYGLVEVLHLLAARSADDSSLALLFKSHPAPAAAKPVAVEGARALQQQEEGGTTIPSGGSPLPGGGSGILRGIFGR